jgi:hypothetical protein
MCVYLDTLTTLQYNRSLEVVNQVSKRAHESTYVNQLKKSYKKNIKTVCPSEEKGKGKKEQPCACPLDCQ